MNLTGLQTALDQLHRWPDAEVVIILFDPTTGEPLRYTATAGFSSGPSGQYLEVRPKGLHHHQFKPWGASDPERPLTTPAGVVK